MADSLIGHPAVDAFNGFDDSVEPNRRGFRYGSQVQIFGQSLSQMETLEKNTKMEQN